VNPRRPQKTTWVKRKKLENTSKKRVGGRGGGKRDQAQKKKKREGGTEVHQTVERNPVRLKNKHAKLRPQTYGGFCWEGIKCRHGSKNKVAP